MDNTGQVSVHYHIITNTGFSIIRDFAENYGELQEKIQKRIQMVKDLTGSDIKKTTEYATTFDKNEKVIWQPCIDNTCGIKSTHRRVR